jgi:hypothetical protein
VLCAYPPLQTPYCPAVTHKSDTSMSHTCRFQSLANPPPLPTPCCPNPNPCQLSPRSAHENNHSVMLLLCRPPVCYSYYMLRRPDNETVKNCTADFCWEYKSCVISVHIVTMSRAIDENNEEVACFLIRSGCDLNAPRRPGPAGQGQPLSFKPVLRIRIRIFLGHLDPDSAPDPSIIKQN